MEYDDIMQTKPLQAVTRQFPELNEKPAQKVAHKDRTP